MKYIKLYEEFVNEASAVEDSTIMSLLLLKKILPRRKFVEQEFEFDPEEGYDSVDSFSTKVSGLDDDLYINVYDGKNFCFFYDADPISTSAHTKSDADQMSRTGIEVPLPLSKLTKDLFAEVVRSLKDLYENFVNEEISLGLKAKAFAKKIRNQMETFNDAMKADEPLPKEWHDALKRLNIKRVDAAVCYFDAVGSKQDVLDAAELIGLNYLEIEDSEGGSDGIVFSYKQ